MIATTPLKLAPPFAVDPEILRLFNGDLVGQSSIDPLAEGVTSNGGGGTMGERQL